MAIEHKITAGDLCLKQGDFLGAISNFTEAIKENPKAFAAFLKRSTAFQKLKNYDDAKSDISKAFTIAQERGKRAEIGTCYFKLALLYYLEKSYKSALTHIIKAIEYDCQEPTVQMWKNKMEYDVKKHPEENLEKDELELFEEQLGKEEPVVHKEETIDQIEKSKISEDKPKEILHTKGELKKEETFTTAHSKEAVSVLPELNSTTADATAPSTNIDVINQYAPLRIKIREDWYQTDDSIVITIYAKNVKDESIHFESKSISVSFPNGTGSEYNYNLEPLYDEISVEDSKYKVYGTKLEITLVKKNKRKWATLEGSNAVVEAEDNSAMSYPTSSKKAINWSKFKVEEDEGEKDGEDFFKNLYKDVDDDTRRAMMKSYVQSNGTVLTTNWKEAQEKEFETSPPEGMEARKW